jgi:hypothetical protein
VYFRSLRRVKVKATMPSPSRATVAGSGTGGGGIVATITRNEEIFKTTAQKLILECRREKRPGPINWGRSIVGAYTKKSTSFVPVVSNEYSTPMNSTVRVFGTTPIQPSDSTSSGKIVFNAQRNVATRHAFSVTSSQ